MTPSPSPAPAQPPLTQDEILTEARAAVANFNAAAVRLNRAMAALQAYCELQRVRQQ
jgi:hypothetical protein